MTQHSLIKDEVVSTQKILKAAQALQEYSEDQLNRQPAEGKWSVLECLEHLNLYGDFYHPEMKKRMAAAAPSPADAPYKGTVLGNYFVKSVGPETIAKTMNTFKDKNPSGSKLEKKTTLDRFIKQQEELLELLTAAKNVDLKKVKTGITISNWIKLRLGDTIRVVVHHNERHWVQLENVLKTIGAPIAETA